MWTPELGATISLVVGSSSFLTPSAKGPVALMTPYSMVRKRPLEFEMLKTHSTTDGPLLSGHLVLQAGGADPVLSSARRVRLLVQSRDLDVVGHHGAVLNGSHDEGDVHARVVVLTWKCVSSKTQLAAESRITHHRSRRLHRPDRPT